MGQRRSILVFYPHGNLVLARTHLGDEKKIAAGDWGAHLLSTIVGSWVNEDSAPLIVSEGDSDEKVLAINSSRYLGRVLESVLPEVGSTLVLYGWAFSEQDRHILDALLRGGVARIAVSIHLGAGGNPQARCAQSRHRILDAVPLGKAAPRIDFFDPASRGAWIY